MTKDEQVVFLQPIMDYVLKLDYCHPRWHFSENDDDGTMYLDVLEGVQLYVYIRDAKFRCVDDRRGVTYDKFPMSDPKSYEKVIKFFEDALNGQK